MDVLSNSAFEILYLGIYTIKNKTILFIEHYYEVGKGGGYIYMEALNY
jgi:hypothetical protein